jgi:ABC-2 type transport system ATP-binding protein
MIRIGDIATLTQQKGTFMIGLAMGQDLPQAEIARLGYSVTEAGDLWEVGLGDGQTIDPVVDLLRQRGLSLRHLVEKRMSLEDLFMQTVEGAEPGVDEPRGRRQPPPPREGRPRYRQDEERYRR